MAADSISPSSAERIAVITVSFNSGSALHDFLPTIATATRQQVAAVVVDNVAEGDPDARRLAEAAGARYLALGRNAGYGGGINAALQQLSSSTEWVLVSNPDVQLGVGSIDRLVSTAEADPAIGAIGPAIYDSSGALYPSARAIPSLSTGIGHALFERVWPTNPWTRAYRQDAADSDRPRSVGWLSGACVLVRFSVLQKLEGFDESFFMYFEDVDLGHRIGQAGYRNEFEPRATVIHSGAHSTTSDSTRMLAAHHASARRFLAKRYPGVVWWPVRSIMGLGLRVRLALISRRR